MKELLLFCLLACAGRVAGQGLPVPAADMKVAVSAYVIERLAVPSSYSPLTWGEPKHETQQSQNIDKAAAELEQAMIARKLASENDKKTAKMRAAGASLPAQSRSIEKSIQLLELAKVHNLRMDSLTAVTDTTRLGTGIMHTYRCADSHGVVSTKKEFFILFFSGEMQAIKQ